MPWTKIEDVPASILKHKGATLTLEQANKWGEIFDSLKENSNVSDPAAAAWSAWEEIYELKDGQWVAREREAAESMIWVEESAFAEAVDGAVVERDSAGLPSKIRVLLIQAGKALTKERNYPPQPLKELAESGMLDNLKMYDGHPDGSEVVPGATLKARSMRDYLSYILPGTAKFEEKIKLKTGQLVSGITGVVKLIDRDFKYKIAEAAETIGISLNSICDAIRNPNGETVIQKIRRATSADWLTGTPNCGGRVLEFVEAADPNGKEVTNQMEWKDITAEELKKNRPDLIESINTEAQAAKAAAEAEKKAADEKAAAAQTTAAAATAEATTAKAEVAESAKQLAAKDKVLTDSTAQRAALDLKAKAIEMVESKCSGMNILAKAHVMKETLAKEYATEQEMTESVEAEIAKAPHKEPSKGTPPAAGTKEETALPAGSQEFAEDIGLSEAERERLAKVR
jgi:hypothetical protein